MHQELRGGAEPFIMNRRTSFPGRSGVQGINFYLIGRCIAARRLEAGWTQRELARRAGIGLRTVAAAEAGAHVQMALPVFVGLARALGLSMDRLFAQEEASRGG
jgi:DNA-binding XRE family transcriptional regulator